MKRAFAPFLCAGIAVASCVPATEDLDPHGAAGFELAPTAATRGEPFDTTDGYRITIDRLVLLVSVQAGPLQDHADDFYGSSDWVLFEATSPEPVYCPGLPVGDFGLSLLFTELLQDDPEEPAMAPDARAYLPRFRAAPDVGRAIFVSERPTTGYGPSWLLQLHAEGHGRRYSLDLTFDGSYDFGGGTLGTVRVRANELATTPVVLRAEELFVDREPAPCSPFCGPSCVADCLVACAPGPTDPYGCRSYCATACAEGDTAGNEAPAFAAFARADTDQDGILTAPELRAGKLEEDSFRNLGQELLERSSRLFAAPEGTPGRDLTPP